MSFPLPVDFEAVSFGDVFESSFDEFLVFIDVVGYSSARTDWKYMDKITQ